MSKFLKIGTDGMYTEESTVSTGGGGNEGKVPQLGVGGKFDVTMLPDGLGADTESIVAFEGLSADTIVSLMNDAGTLKCRRADAGTNRYAAYGFVKAAVTSGELATIYKNGTCGGTFALADVMKPVFVGETPGVPTLTPVAGSGKLHQIAGIVSSATTFDFEVGIPTLLV